MFEDTDFELRDFPFEMEDLNICYRFPRHESQGIRSIRHDRDFMDQDFLVEKLSDKEIEHEEYNIDHIEHRIHRKPGAMAHFLESECVIMTKRKPYFWMTSIIGPNLLLSLIGLNVFLIGPEDNSDFFCDRISLITTLILTSVAFQFSVNAILPSLPCKFKPRALCHVPCHPPSLPP